MDLAFRDRFIDSWERYFPGAELPITFHYAAAPGSVELAPASQQYRCFIAQLAQVRKGRSMAYGVDSVGCPGAKRYLGFSQQLMPHFDHFLSCGIPAVVEGERFKKSPELVRELLKSSPAFHAPEPYIVFKRWDRLESEDEPEVAIFFARPDVLAGLFTLANFDETDLHGVVAPFSAGCGSIVQHPYLEKYKEHPRGVLGMFDVAARDFVAADILSFAVPMGKFTQMIDNMDESFLITRSWKRVRKRLSETQDAS